MLLLYQVNTQSSDLLLPGCSRMTFIPSFSAVLTMLFLSLVQNFKLIFEFKTSNNQIKSMETLCFTCQ